jgi:hypothetical protein
MRSAQQICKTCDGSFSVDQSCFMILGQEQLDDIFIAFVMYII